MTKKELRQGVKDYNEKDLRLLSDLYIQTGQEDRLGIVKREQKRHIGKVDGQLVMAT